MGRRPLYLVGWTTGNCLCECVYRGSQLTCLSFTGGRATSVLRRVSRSHSQWLGPHRKQWLAQGTQTGAGSFPDCRHLGRQEPKGEGKYQNHSVTEPTVPTLARNTNSQISTSLVTKRILLDFFWEGGNDLFSPQRVRKSLPLLTLRLTLTALHCGFH